MQPSTWIWIGSHPSVYVLAVLSKNCWAKWFLSTRIFQNFSVKYNPTKGSIGYHLSFHEVSQFWWHPIPSKLERSVYSFFYIVRGILPIYCAVTSLGLCCVPSLKSWIYFLPCPCGHPLLYPCFWPHYSQFIMWIIVTAALL